MVVLLFLAHSVLCVLLTVEIPRFEPKPGVVLSRITAKFKHSCLAVISYKTKRFCQLSKHFLVAST